MQAEQYIERVAMPEDLKAIARKTNELDLCMEFCIHTAFTGYGSYDLWEKTCEIIASQPKSHVEELYETIAKLLDMKPEDTEQHFAGMELEMMEGSEELFFEFVEYQKGHGLLGYFTCPSEHGRYMRGFFHNDLEGLLLKATAWAEEMHGLVEKKRNDSE